ncbi:MULTISPECIES: DUF397 domain-containing protein [unclassified Streptomyces]|uniref:DUF397 domain-containing protein n=1 Tax=unclassified Streptomyces TaxID=2593676 RepID=UPI00081F5CC3|nr:MULTISPECIES: DUF397 domain-containing protein [unclassified Streptomyces]MYR29093.1 DUF397 domain-containing protein [Streptomyces sp. SID4945]SCF43744.1 protein of unknown function [Streptomyces sp. LcepLS]
MHTQSNWASGWRKSSYSDTQGSDCVEVAPSPTVTAARDSKTPAGPVLTFSAPTWSAFLSHLAVSQDR